MAATTRYNGSFGNYATGTLRSVLQLKAFVIDAGGDLQAQDSDSAGEVDQAVEAVVREVQPLMYFTPSAGDGLIHVIVDGHAVDADTLQARIRALGTVNSLDLSSATVTEASSLTAA
jgi:hypothetical protein